MLSRLYESVLERRLRNIVEEKLGPWQHGFERGKGGTTYLTFVLRQFMEKHWEYDTPMYLGFLDLEKHLTEYHVTKYGTRWTSTKYNQN